MKTPIVLPDTREFELFLERQNKIISKNNKKITDLQVEITNSVSNFKIASFKFKNTPVSFSQTCMEDYFKQVFQKTQKTDFKITELNLWYKEILDSKFHTTNYLEIEYKFNQKEIIYINDFCTLFHDEDSLRFGQNNRSQSSFYFTFKNASQYADFIEKINVFKKLKKQYLF